MEKTIKTASSVGFIATKNKRKESEQNTDKRREKMVR